MRKYPSWHPGESNPARSRRRGPAPFAVAFRSVGRHGYAAVCFATLLFALLVLAARPAAAQDVPDSLRLPTPDSLAVQPDSLPPDQPLPLPGQTPPAPAPAANPSGLKAPIQFTAQDSLIIVFDDDGGDLGTLFGQARVGYDDASLQAFSIAMLFEQDELKASGLPSDTGLVGRPTFQQGGETFYGNQLAYNMRTERGRVVEAQTLVPQGEGTIKGGVVKVLEDSTLFIENAAYTTCPCVDDPSYTLRSSKMKVRGKWIYSGPIRLFLYNIPTPLWLPFGFLPAQQGRRSGPLPPNYGEDERGFYLRDWGWYWAINDYMDLQVRAGIWTRGSWQIAPLYRYAKRYRYNGQLEFSYVHSRTGERLDPDFLKRNAFSIRWNHSQTISPTASFSGNVNLASESHLRTVSEDYDDRVRQSIQSSIQYRKRWGSGRSFNASVNQNQQLATDQVSLTLPRLSFTQSQVKPFEHDRRPADQDPRWYERITFSYSGSLNNTFNYQPTSDTLEIAWYEALVSPSKYEAATGDNTPFTFRATHSVPISAPFSIRRLPVLNRTFILNVSPSLRYSEDWFLQTDRRFFDEEAGRVVTEQEPGFFALRQFSSGVSANTTVYGLFPVGLGPYQGLRHTIRPSLGFTYRPDFSSDFWGYTATYRDTAGTLISYDRVPGVPSGLQKTVSLGFDNVFETKRIETDSTGEETATTLQLLTLNASSNYNFAADSLKLSDLNLSWRTRLFGEIAVNGRATFSPYQLNEDRTRVVDRYVLGDGLRVARLTSFSLSANTRLRSQRRTGAGRPLETSRAGFPDPSSVPGAASRDLYQDALYNTLTGYADFDIPWSLGLDVSYSINKRLAELTRRAIVNVSFDFNATPNWKIQGRTGYDFERREVVSTNLSISRDFECWQMSFRWVPFGAYQSYSFSLQVKSGPLRDILRLTQPRSDIRGRFSGLTGV